MGQMKFEIFRGGFLRTQWFFRIVAGNGEVVAQSEGYTRKDKCINTVRLIRDNVQGAPVYNDNGERLA